MSVTFYDRNNPVKYDADYNIIGGGPEANFSNVNARMILNILELETDVSLYGEIPAKELICVIERTIARLNEYKSDNRTKIYLENYILDSFQKIKQVAESSLKHSGIVVWA
jgi:hypothetical protein